MLTGVLKRFSRSVKVSRFRQPEDMSLGQWQAALRRQFALEQKLELTNLGKHPVFSEFSVFNPHTRRTYRLSIRGEEPGMNYCSCPDYAVNTLGTCKHIEFALSELRERHARALAEGWHPPFSEVFLRYGPKRVVMFGPGTDCPASLRRLASRFFAEDGAIQAEALRRFDRFIEQAQKVCQKADHELRFYEDARVFIAERRDARSRRDRLRARYAGRRAAAAWRGLLRVPLFPYQREGALFAAQAGRAVIADDMGLGKTIQAIAAAELLARHCAVERVLVICPSTLKYQWLHEIGRFTRRAAVVVEGPGPRRHSLYQAPEPFFKIANYDVIHRDLAALAEWRPDMVILDEAQRIKNWQTRAARAVKRIESRFALVLTGTPLENRLEELHSIVEFVDRHRLGPLFAFKAEHEEHEPDSSRVVGYRNLGEITRTLAPILIRRTRDEVLRQLPPRMDKNFFVPMTSPQWQPHNENREVVARLVAKWKRYRFLSEADQLRLRIALQIMRMACDSTYLVDHQTRHGTKVDELARLLGEVFETPGSKAVIFSQWNRMHELVADMLEDQRWGHVHLHGGLASTQRESVIATFRDEADCRVFLSTDAGGVGLNLQHAANIINLDLPWNPAILEQRIGRVHRMGQSQPVRVVNFISEGTIEHGMLSLLSFKKSIFSGVLDGTADKVMMGDRALGRFMKTIEATTAGIPPVPAFDEPPAGDDGGQEVLDSQEDGELGQQPPADQPVQAVPVRAIAPAAPAPDASALGRLLAQGAELLSSLGKTLAETPVDGPVHLPPDSPLTRITTDSGTGRREIRLPLPDDQTLQRWVGQMAEAVRAIAAKR